MSNPENNDSADLYATPAVEPLQVTAANATDKVAEHTASVAAKPPHSELNAKLRSLVEGAISALLSKKRSADSLMKRKPKVVQPSPKASRESPGQLQRAGIFVSVFVIGAMVGYAYGVHSSGGAPLIGDTKKSVDLDLNSFGKVSPEEPSGEKSMPINVGGVIGDHSNVDHQEGLAQAPKQSATSASAPSDGAVFKGEMGEVLKPEAP